MLGGIIIAVGLFVLLSAGTPGSALLGIVLVVIGGIVFWRNSETKKYFDGR